MQTDIDVLEGNMKNDERKRQRQNKGDANDKKRKHYINTSLFRSFEKNSAISENDLKKLTKKRYTYPVISLYLTITPDKLIRSRKTYLTYWNSLKNEKLKEQEEKIKHMPHEQKTSLRKDIAEIDDYLQNFFDPEDTKTLILFKSSDDLRLVIKLPVLLEHNHLIFNAAPYTSPLEPILESYKKVFIVHIEKEQAHFYTFILGTLHEVDRIKSFVPTDSVDKSIPNKVQRHRRHHLLHHVETIAEKLSDYQQKFSFNYLVFIGDEATLSMLEQHLSADLKDRVVGKVLLGPHQSKEVLKEKVRHIINQQEQTKEEKILQELYQYEGEGLLTEGLEPTIKAQNRFLVRKLVVEQDFSKDGFLCPLRHYLSLSNGTCPNCKRKLIPTEDIVEELINNAREQNVDLEVMQFKKNEMNHFDHIAAVTYTV